MAYHCHTMERAMEQLNLSDAGSTAAPRLDTLPDDILLIVLSHLHTAQSVARLEATSKRLRRVARAEGWRVFVRTCFPTLTITPPSSDGNGNGNGNGDDGWKHLARDLTGQSRDWDRRAFAVRLLTRHPHYRPQMPEHYPRGRWRHHALRHQHRLQTVACHVVLDAHAQQQGGGPGVAEQETVVWGAGEDVVALRRGKSREHATVWQRWQWHKGAPDGLVGGRDDVTCLRILRETPECASHLALGRASGDLRLVSLEEPFFGQTVRHFQPATSSTTGTAPASASSNSRRPAADHQREIQALDVHEKTNRLAAATKERVLLYPLLDEQQASPNDSHAIIPPSDTLHLKDAEGRGSPDFRFIRTMRLLDDATIALGVNTSTAPLRYLQLTPTGIEPLTAPNIHHDGSDDWRLGTVRSILPMSSSGVAGARGNLILTSWDDGTIRLQDLRTPSAFDRVYQDHFEPTTPVNALAAYGLERFVAGSARAPVLKIFDFRWSSSGSSSSSSGGGGGPGRGRGYDYTEAMACSPEAPRPPPRPPTLVAKPYVGAPRAACDRLRLAGDRPCTWHALSRASYYRPNCNVYLPKRAGTPGTPVHSLARGSDTSPTLYAGLSGSLVEMTLRSSGGADEEEHDHNGHDDATSSHTASYHDNNNHSRDEEDGGMGGGAPPPLYLRTPAKVNIIETGDGTVLGDVSESQRMPVIRAQAERRGAYGRAVSADAARRHRLDEWLQDAHDFFVG